MTTAREGEIMRAQQASDAQFGRYPHESPTRRSENPWGPPDLSAILVPGCPEWLQTEAAMLAALQAGPLTGHQLFRRPTDRAPTSTCTRPPSSAGSSPGDAFARPRPAHFSWRYLSDEIPVGSD